MTVKTKLALLGVVLVALGLAGAGLYCRGRRAGIAKVEVTQATEEVAKLEETKDEVKVEVDRGDSVALRHRILALAGELGSKRPGEGLSR